jgi:O-antigen/teichoic acid export membrane protein
MIFGFMFGPVLPVLYSHFAEIQSDVCRVQKVLVRVVKVITFIALPLAFILFALATPISRIAFGDQWIGVEVVIGVMALMQGVSWTVGANGEAYRAIGRPDYETKIMASVLLFYLVAYLVSVRYGLEAFLWTRLSLALAAMSIHLWVARIAVGFPIGPTLVYLAKISVVGLPLILLAVNVELLGDSAWLQLGVGGSLAALCTMAYLWLLERRTLIPDVFTLLTRERPRGT